ncbi:hypothetical protein BKA70DRAFT_1097160 [Coprinopsis sp. MPI-PUGE-AT-0042]|nr:hypothetical protein BKA70DRAFT_1097160 [Coprinopsis sp. MPI-PUGE-AT-0042]
MASESFSASAASSLSSGGPRPTSFPSAVPAALSDLSSTSYLSATATSLAACITLMIGLTYLVALSCVYKHACGQPKALNKVSGVWIVRWAPFAYVLLVIISLCEIAMSSWLLLQYRFHHNHPNGSALLAIRFLMFPACWTSLTSATYSILFLHPSYSKHPLSSIGAQSVWIFLTWIFWVVGAGMLNAAVPRALMDLKEGCVGVVYCEQIRGVFGELSLDLPTIISRICVSIQCLFVISLPFRPLLILTGGLCAILWLAWQSARDTWTAANRPFSVMSRTSRVVGQKV